MAKQLVDDALREVIKPPSPPPPRRTSPRGRPRLSDRAALTGILFVANGRAIVAEFFIA